MSSKLSKREIEWLKKNFYWLAQREKALPIDTEIHKLLDTDAADMLMANDQKRAYISGMVTMFRNNLEVKAKQYEMDIEKSEKLIETGEKSKAEMEKQMADTEDEKMKEAFKAKIAEVEIALEQRNEYLGKLPGYLTNVYNIQVELTNLQKKL